MEQKRKKEIASFKDKAKLFSDKEIRAVVKTLKKDYYFCEILNVGEEKLLIYNFTGKRYGQKDEIYWTDIFEIDEYAGPKLKENKLMDSEPKTTMSDIIKEVKK